MRGDIHRSLAIYGVEYPSKAFYPLPPVPAFPLRKLNTGYESVAARTWGSRKERVYASKDLICGYILIREHSREEYSK